MFVVLKRTIVVHHFPLLSLNCFDIKMMVAEDYENAIVNIDGEV